MSRTGASRPDSSLSESPSISPGRLFARERAMWSRGDRARSPGTDCRGDLFHSLGLPRIRRLAHGPGDETDGRKLLHDVGDLFVDPFGSTMRLRALVHVLRTGATPEQPARIGFLQVDGQGAPYRLDGVPGAAVPCAGPPVSPAVAVAVPAGTPGWSVQRLFGLVASPRDDIDVWTLVVPGEAAPLELRSNG